VPGSSLQQAPAVSLFYFVALSGASIPDTKGQAYHLPVPDHKKGLQDE